MKFSLNVGCVLWVDEWNSKGLFPRLHALLADDDETMMEAKKKGGVDKKNAISESDDVAVAPYEMPIGFGRG